MINKLNKLLLTNVPVLHRDLLWEVFPLPLSEANLSDRKSSLCVLKSWKLRNLHLPDGSEQDDLPISENNEEY